MQSLGFHYYTENGSDLFTVGLRWGGGGGVSSRQSASFFLPGDDVPLVMWRQRKIFLIAGRM